MANNQALLARRQPKDPLKFSTIGSNALLDPIATVQPGGFGGSVEEVQKQIDDGNLLTNRKSEDIFGQDKGLQEGNFPEAPQQGFGQRRFLSPFEQAQREKAIQLFGVDPTVNPETGLNIDESREAEKLSGTFGNDFITDRNRARPLLDIDGEKTGKLIFGGKAIDDPRFQEPISDFTASILASNGVDVSGLLGRGGSSSNQPSSISQPQTAPNFASSGGAPIQPPNQQFGGKLEGALERESIERQGRGGLQVSGAKLGGITTTNPQAEANKQALSQETKEASKSARTTRKAQAQLKQTLTTYAKMANRTKELTGLEPGRVGGIATKALGLAGVNEFAGPFKGDLVETATSIAKIAAPSAKVGPDFIKLFSKTLPSEFSTFGEARNQTILSITNGFFDFAATHPEQFPEGIDAELFTKEVTKMVDALVAKEKEIFQDLGSAKGKQVGAFTVEES